MVRFEMRKQNKQEFAHVGLCKNKYLILAKEMLKVHNHNIIEIGIADSKKDLSPLLS